MIYPILNTKIKEILEGCDKIQSIYPYPANKIDGYPTAIFYPSTIGNSFETTSENFKVYSYKLWIVVNVAEETVEEGFNSIMPEVMDQVLAEFDENWDFDNIDGHRVWAKVETGLWTVSPEQAGIDITAEIDLSIKLLTNN